MQHVLLTIKLPWAEYAVAITRYARWCQTRQEIYFSQTNSIHQIMKIISVQPKPESTGCLPVLQEVEHEFDI